MTDIVERLRKLGHPKDWHTPGHPMNGWVTATEAQSLGSAAADEIERLRAAIDGIRWVLDGEHGERVWSGGGLLVRVDAPEQGDERPRMMAGLWPKPEGEATHCLADDPDPTEQGDDR